MKKDKRKIIYVPEPEQHNLAQTIRDIIVKDVIVRDMLASYLVKRYNELAKAEKQKVRTIRV